MSGAALVILACGEQSPDDIEVTLAYGARLQVRVSGDTALLPAVMGTLGDCAMVFTLSDSTTRVYPVPSDQIAEVRVADPKGQSDEALDLEQVRRYLQGCDGGEGGG